MASKGTNFVDKHDDQDSSEADVGNSEQSLNIARRTRSHFRIDDFVPNDNLDFPDVDMNLYQDPSSEGDVEYKKFLNQCYSEEVNIENTNNTDENDQDYVYNDDIFSHGWKFDLNEVRELHHNDQEDANGDDDNNDSNDPKRIGNVLEGLSSYFISTDLITQNHDHSIEHNNNHFTPESQSNYSASNHLHTLTRCDAPLTIPYSPSSKGLALKNSTTRRKIHMFSDPQFAKILNQQLRQHVQLLTQAYLLTKHTTNMHTEADEAKSHLNSYMMIFKNKNKPSNLLPALELVNNMQTPKDLKSSIRLNWRQLPVPELVKKVINENPNVFIYPNLLPQVAFSILTTKFIPKKPKIYFTLNEDKLLAYALNEFKGESTPYAFIASLLMTAKTKTQISNHIKNIKRSPGNEDNPIKLYYSNGLLPEIDLEEDLFVADSFKQERPERKLEIVGGDENCDDIIDPIKPLGNGIAENSLTFDENFSSEPNSCGNIRETEKMVCDEDQPEVVSIQTNLNNSDNNNEKQGEENDEKNLAENEEAAHKQELPATADNQSAVYQDHDDLMNMNLDDLMAASTTIFKSTIINSNNSENTKNIKNLKLKKSMLNLMSHNYSLSKDMGDLIIYEFLKTAQQKLPERTNFQLLQLMAELLTKKDSTSHDDTDLSAIKIYNEIGNFLRKNQAPSELIDKIVLFLDLNQASKCGCSFDYLHWIRFFQFMQRVQLYHQQDGIEALEKKLSRLVDALQKDDSHKIKLAIGNLISKHPFLKREFDSLSLDEKPHPSLFICEEDFDDITDPVAAFDKDHASIESENYSFEHINPKLSKEELDYASQACPCKCHQDLQTSDGQLSQHCEKCNLKFMKGRMYLVSKIKPILAEWTYRERLYEPKTSVVNDGPTTIWTFEEDRDILEFCRTKAEQNDETVSFDTSTFEELVLKRQADPSRTSSKKSAREIAERFNQLMDLYKDENSISTQS